MWYQHDQNPLWRRLIEKKVKRLAEIAVEKKDYVYFNNRRYDTLLSEEGIEVGPTYTEIYFTADDKGPIQNSSGGEGRFKSLYSAHATNFQLSRNLCVAYRVTGHKPALELAGKIIRGVLVEPRKAFDNDGRWRLWHFHTTTASLLAILDYARLTEDAKLLELVRKGYEYGKVLGDPVVGFFPELLPGSEQDLKRPMNSCETCEVADMIGLGLKLTQAGAGEYWEDVDRWVRNQFVENQLTSVDWVDNLQADAFKFLPGTTWGTESSKLEFEKPVRHWESTDIRRAIGSFAGWALPNDWGKASMHMCCTGNAGRTLYWIWDSILTHKDGKVTVNLLLNRASPWADVDSYLLFKGKVALKIKEAQTVAVRIPQWTNPAQVACSVNGKRQTFVWSGNHVEVGDLRRGNTVTVQFPMREKILFRVISRFPYKLTIKGNTVVGIDPKGKINPIYQRDKYRQDEAPMQKVTRFVSRERLLW